MGLSHLSQSAEILDAFHGLTPRQNNRRSNTRYLGSVVAHRLPSSCVIHRYRKKQGVRGVQVETTLLVMRLVLSSRQTPFETQVFQYLHHATFCV